MTVTTANLGPDSTMQQVLEAFPGARRALFRKYHLGGCSSCGFQPDETLGALCARNGGLDVAEVAAHIQSSHAQDQQMLITAEELAERSRGVAPPRVLDIRSREEWDAARIEGSLLLTQELMQEILARWPREALFVVCDHDGRQGLDAAAYFAGHGFTQIRCLRGGIDAWSQEVDPAVPRYTLT